MTRVITDIHFDPTKKPKMLTIAQTLKEAITGTCEHLTVETDDNIMSSITIRGNYTPKEEWQNGIYENGQYFIFSISPMNEKRYYDDSDKKVTVELYIRPYGMDKKFRKSTCTPEKAIQRIVEWIKK